jgi:flagellar assembly protein FliH
MNLKTASSKDLKWFGLDQPPINLLLSERRRANEMAEVMIKDAQELAHQIVAQAHIKAEAIRKQAQESGKEEGLAVVAKEVAEIGRWQATIIEKTRHELLNLAIEISSRILRQEIAAQPEVIANICREIIRENAPGRRITLVVHPSDMSLLSKNIQELTSLEQNMSIRFEPSEKIQRGECLVRSELGQVDGRLSTQLNELRKLLETSDALKLNRS